jgi:molybdate transport system substrate-binding protein
MRFHRLAAAPLLAVFLASAADAAGIEVYCPPLVGDGLTTLAAAFTAQTGTVVTIHADVMGTLVPEVKSKPSDLVVLPPDLMDSFARDGGIKPGSRVKLARAEIALAVPAGAPHPDISTLAKTRAVLASARALVYSEPGPPRNSMEAGIIDALLKRPQFANVHAVSLPQDQGSGVQGMAAGKGDMSLQVIPEILVVKGVEVVGPLPPQLGAHIDTVAAISSHAADPRDAAAFLRYITRPAAAPVWKKAGLSFF